MPLRPDPGRARAARGRLDALREVLADVEDEVLACLVVTGEPGPQRVLDDWLDQVADTTRALGESAAEVSLALARLGGAETAAQGAAQGAGDGRRSGLAPRAPR